MSPSNARRNLTRAFWGYSLLSSSTPFLNSAIESCSAWPLIFSVANPRLMEVLREQISTTYQRRRNICIESTGLTVSINQQGEKEAVYARARKARGAHLARRPLELHEKPRNEGGLTGAGARNSIVGS